MATVVKPRTDWCNVVFILDWLGCRGFLLEFCVLLGCRVFMLRQCHCVFGLCETLQILLLLILVFITIIVNNIDNLLLVVIVFSFCLGYYTYISIFAVMSVIFFYKYQINIFWKPLADREHCSYPLAAKVTSVNNCLALQRVTMPFTIFSNCFIQMQIKTIQGKLL